MNILVNEKLAATRGVDGRPLVRVVIAGHVDHGKSTLIGRLLHETNSLPDGKLELLKAVSERRGVAFEWSFLLDALQTERDQGITLDTSQIRFRTSARDVVLIDAPGHAEFLRNMITGAAQADAAVLVVDATEGLRDQTRRHCYLLHLLGIAHVAVVVNKMDRVGFDQTRFLELEAEIAAHFASLGLSATAIIPTSARHGDGVERRTVSIAWYTGPTLLEVLDRFSPAKPLTELPLRIPVQAVYKFDDRRIVAGRIESGRLNVGDEITIMPRQTTARIKSIEAWPEPNDAQRPQRARAGQSIGVTLDRQIFVERGDVISAVPAPAKLVARAWGRAGGRDETPLAAGATIGVRVGMAERRGTIVAINNAVDPGALEPTAVEAIARNHVGEIELALAQPIAGDLYAVNPRTGRLVLDLGTRIAGGGLILAVDNNAEAIGAKAERRALPGADRKSLAVQAASLNAALSSLPPAERLARFRSEVAGNLVFTTSFGLEDQVILQMICERGLDIDIVTLDTGRLFPETYELWAETERRYGRRIRAGYPRHEKLEALVEKHGINGFYESVEVRQSCCHVRKVEPLNRALAGAAGWIV